MGISAVQNGPDGRDGIGSVNGFTDSRDAVIASKIVGQLAAEMPNRADFAQCPGKIGDMGHGGLDTLLGRSRTNLATLWVWQRRNFQADSV